MVYTNINIIEKLLLKNGKKDSLWKFQYKFERKFNKTDPEAKDEFDTVRDLELIFKETEKKGRKFGEHNTILIDSDDAKTRFCKKNRILIP